MVTLKTHFARLAEATSNTIGWRRDAVAFFVEAAKRGPVAALPMALARQEVFTINGKAAIAEVLNDSTRFSKDTRGQDLLRVVLGVGLLTSQGTTWRERRRIAQPAFRKPKLEVYRAQMVEVSERVRDRLAGQQTVDLGDEMMRLTLEVATRTLFADHFDDAEVVSEAMDVILAAYMRLLGNPLPHPERLPTPAARSYRRAISELNRVVDGLIARRRERGTDGDDLLHLWLHSGLDDEAVRNEVITMLLAAHETTANTLTFALALLSRNPQVRRKLVEELRGLETLSPDAAAAPYLEAVINEALRMYPPAWITARCPVEDTELEGVHLPAGSLLLIPIHALQNDPEAWPNPQGFDPDRWATKPEGLWMPFGAGQRKCIGSHFAMLEMRTALTVLLRDLELDLEPGVTLTLEPSVTLRPAEPIKARVNRR